MLSLVRYMLLQVCSYESCIVPSFLEFMNFVHWRALKKPSHNGPVHCDCPSDRSAKLPTAFGINFLFVYKQPELLGWDHPPPPCQQCITPNVFFVACHTSLEAMVYMFCAWNLTCYLSINESKPSQNNASGPYLFGLQFAASCFSRSSYAPTWMASVAPNCRPNSSTLIWGPQWTSKPLSFH